MERMVVAPVQMLSELSSLDENIAQTREWVARAADAGAALVVFPECSLTGYVIENPGDAVCRADDERLLALEEFARSLDVAIGYGFAETVPSQALPYITYVVAHDGQRMLYRKSHLGGSEAKSYAAGDALPVAQVKGVTLGVQLCWEGHIPDITTTLRAKGAELLVMPHAGGLAGARRLDSWSRYLPARALDNGMYVVACNALRYGMQPAHSAIEGHSSQDDDGGLAVYGPNGKLLDSYHGSDAHMMLVEIGGNLPRDDEGNGKMVASYFDRRRPELYR